MTFHNFCLYLEKIEAITSRNRITEILAEIFSELEPREIDATCWLLLGRIVPPYEGLEFQFAEKMMVRAIARAYDHEPDEVQAKFKTEGDLAAVAENYAQMGAQQKQTHTIASIYQALTLLAKENGEGSQERKIAQVVSLLQALDSSSVRYVVRIILTKLRLGFSDMTILDALSWAKYGDKSRRKVLEDAYQMKCDIGKLATVFLTDGEDGLTHVDIELGIPLQPALCQRLKTAQEMIDKMGTVFVEPKYDGTRVQIHINGKRDETRPWKYRSFTRSLEESSHMFPELAQAQETLGSHSLILDCEAIGYDAATDKLLPFQETIQRKRKHDVGEMSQKIPLRFFVFDILFLDGKSLLATPLCERKKILNELFSPKNQYHLGFPFILSKAIVTDDADTLRSFHAQQLAAGLEGAVIKKYDSVYQPGRKGWSWVKFKEEEGAEGKLSDTIDAIVMGYWYGKGKRNQFGIGAFLIGVPDEKENIKTLSKVGTGLSDDQWKELKLRCESIVTTQQPQHYIVDKLLIPDVWVSPSIVVEVAGDELTKSPNHSAGVALRFPRLVRFRDDKTIHDATSVTELASIA